VEMQQRGRLQNDGGTENACRAHERVHKPAMKRSAARRLGARFGPTIEDLQLMPEQFGFGDDATSPPGIAGRLG
jgi:hypothetical protein